MGMVLYTVVNDILNAVVNYQLHITFAIMARSTIKTTCMKTSCPGISPRTRFVGYTLVYYYDSIKLFQYFFIMILRRLCHFNQSSTMLSKSTGKGTHNKSE